MLSLRQKSKLASCAVDVCHGIDTDAHLFLPYLKRFAADAVQNRQKPTLECVLKHVLII